MPIDPSNAPDHGRASHVLRPDRSRDPRDVAAMTNVILIVIDGCRPDALEMAATPVIDGLIEGGSSTMTARTVEPAITLPAHFSLFTSLNPRDHNVTTNTASPVVSRTACSIFEAAKNHRLRTAAVYSWEPLRNLSPPKALDTSFYLNTNGTGFTDLDVVEHAIRLVVRQQPDFCFLYLEGVDQAGHADGWMSPSYLAAVETADTAVGRLLDALSAAGIDQQYTVVLQSDHGGVDNHHLHSEPAVLTIPWIVCGPGVRRGYRMSTPVSILDTAPTIARLLEIIPHYSWLGSAPEDIFA